MQERIPKLIFTSTTSLKNHGLNARKTSDSVAGLNKILDNEEDSDQLRNKLNACQHFLTVTERENGRHKVFNFQLSKLDPNLLNENRIKSLKNLIV